MHIIVCPSKIGVQIVNHINKSKSDDMKQEDLKLGARELL